MAILPEGKPSPPEMGGYEPAQTSAALAPFHDAAGAIHRCATSGCKGVTAIARGKGLWGNPVLATSGWILWDENRCYGDIYQLSC